MGPWSDSKTIPVFLYWTKYGTDATDVHQKLVYDEKLYYFMLFWNYLAWHRHTGSSISWYASIFNVVGLN
jgi:hypothetical protein